MSAPNEVYVGLLMHARVPSGPRVHLRVTALPVRSFGLERKTSRGLRNGAPWKRLIMRAFHLPVEDHASKSEVRSEVGMQVRHSPELLGRSGTSSHGKTCYYRESERYCRNRWAPHALRCHDYSPFPAQQRYWQVDKREIIRRT